VNQPTEFRPLQSKPENHFCSAGRSPIKPMGLVGDCRPYYGGVWYRARGTVVNHESYYAAGRYNWQVQRRRPAETLQMQEARRFFLQIP
jgi:hypothetical protein